MPGIDPDVFPWLLPLLKYGASQRFLDLRATGGIQMVNGNAPSRDDAANGVTANGVTVVGPGKPHANTSVLVNRAGW